MHLRYITDEWIDLGPGQRVCELSVQYEATARVPVQTRIGATEQAGPGPVRSYVGLMFEIGEVQVQAPGVIRRGEDRFTVEIAPCADSD